MLQESLSGHSKSHQSICSNNVTTDIWGMMTKQPLNISFINWTSFKLYMLKWKETIRYVIYEWPGPEVPYLHACYLELDVTEHVSSSLLEIIYLCLVFFLFFVSLQVNKHSYVPEYCVTLTGRNTIDFSHLYREVLSHSAFVPELSFYTILLIFLTVFFVLAVISPV